MSQKSKYATEDEWHERDEYEKSSSPYCTALPDKFRALRRFSREIIFLNLFLVVARYYFEMRNPFEILSADIKSKSSTQPISNFRKSWILYSSLTTHVTNGKLMTRLFTSPSHSTWSERARSVYYTRRQYEFLSQKMFEPPFSVINARRRFRRGKNISCL